MTRLTPGDVPRGGRPVTRLHGDETGMSDEDFEYEGGGAEVVGEMIAKLKELRAPFSPEQIEKLPKPLGKNAWDNQPSSHCNICGGYHPQVRMIHLDYVGHANTTNRLLEVDPLWEWEPLAYTENGTPYFSDGGLWIKLTVCGVTRLGYGDGKNPKEIIGDAIRNAAMRFGVALDLWSKIDLHAERNPEDGPTSPQRTEHVATGSRGRNEQRSEVATDAPRRAANQDALDELLHVCDENGLDPRAVEERYNSSLGPPELVKASPDDIRNYAAILISECEPDPDAGVPEGTGPGGEAVGSGDGDTASAGADEAGAELRAESDAEGQSSDDGDAEPAESVPADPSGQDPEDTSDVEKKPDDLF